MAFFLFKKIEKTKKRIPAWVIFFHQNTKLCFLTTAIKQAFFLAYAGT
jgi:hypothetical protein